MVIGFIHMHLIMLPGRIFSLLFLYICLIIITYIPVVVCT